MHVLHDEASDVDDLDTQNRNACCSSETDASPSTQVVAGETRKSIQKSLLDYAPLDNKGTKKCTIAVTKFLAFGMHPYTLVEESAFKQLVHELNPRYKMPGRKFFSNTAVPKLYLEGVETLKGILPQNRERNVHVSITCDCWTSLAGQPYIAITVHFINPNWELISACLNCSFFEEDHTAQNIKNVIHDKLEEWGLHSDSIISCTTDNGKNIVNAIDLLKVDHVPCFAHSINIGVNRCIEVTQVKRAVGRLKCLQNSVAHSWKMKREFKDAQELLKCEVKALPSSCPTRWWSTLKLCQRFLENQLPVRKMLQSFPNKKHLMPEGSDITSLANFVEVVSILQDITDNLSGENFVTSSAVLPLIRQIKKDVLVNDEDCTLIKTLKEKILSALIKYEEEDTSLQNLLQKSTFVDPRFKLYFFDSNVKNKVKEGIAAELKNTILNDNEDLTGLHVKSPPKKKKKGLAAVLKEEEDSFADNIDKSAKEIEKYLSMPKIGLDDNPLLWWKYHASSFPGLSTLARKYLCVQGSSVPSERVFSRAGNIINKKRCALSPKCAEMQIFLAYNKKILGM